MKDAIFKAVESSIQKTEAADRKRKAGDFETLAVVEALGISALVLGPAVIIPAALIAGTVGVLDKIKPNHQEARRRHMPDTWLAQVANWEDASVEGSRFLRKLLAKQGHITVEQAAQWLEIERKNARSVAQEQQRKAHLGQSGAAALLAVNQAPGVVEQVLAKAADSVKGGINRASTTFERLVGIPGLVKPSAPESEAASREDMDQKATTEVK